MKGWQKSDTLLVAHGQLCAILRDVAPIAPKTADKIRSAIKSCDGAIRHQTRLEMKAARY